MPVTLLRYQHQRYFAANRGTGTDIVPGAYVEQFAGCDQVALAALQCAKQLILGFGDDLQSEAATISRIAVEVLLECPQAVVFDANALALDRARAVAALIDQHPQFTAARCGPDCRPPAGRPRAH